MLTAMLLAALATAPDGTDTELALSEHRLCWWVALGKPFEALPPLSRAQQSTGWWSIYAKGDVELDATDALGWWGGAWEHDLGWVPPSPRVVSLTGLRDEPWRRHGLELRPWLHGDVLLCVRAGSAYVWGPQATPGRVAGAPLTNFVPAFACVSSDPGACR